VLNRESKSDWCAIVLKVHRIAVKTDFARKCVDHLSETVERVVELAECRHRTVAEARVVRRDEVKAISEGRYQVAEHV
jgi:hypothetical protein